MEANQKTQLIKIFPKKIVNKVDSPYLPLPYSMNPYQGCEHGCIYCYARGTHEFWGYSSGLDFERKILYKPNAADLLQKQFDAKSWRPDTIMLSGNTDCYQPVERQLELTRGLLKVLLEYKNPVSILTKNSLIERDIDLLQELAKDNLVNVSLSITSLDEKLRSHLEPRTSSAKNKLRTIEKLANKNIPVGILIGPVIPGLNSHEIPEIIKQVANHGANWAGYTTIRLFDVTLDLFENWLDNLYPDKKNKVLRFIHESNKKSKEAEQTKKVIEDLFKISRNKYMNSSSPKLNKKAFQRPSNQFNLFENNSF